jgi:hypothetical protein
MDRPRLEVADVIRAHAAQLVSSGVISPARRRVLRDLAVCRTSALGGHADECQGCGHVEVSYNSCRNRHCPKCQGAARAAWVEAQEARLLPVPYFHVVFTLPEEIGALALQNKRALYGLLLRSAAATLEQVAADPKRLGAEIGFVSVLHTWTQTLLHHPHVHCLVPGGGLSRDGARWIACRPGFFLPVRVLGRVFRGKFLAGLEALGRAERLAFQGALAPLADPCAFRALITQARAKEWVVYAKPPFGGPERVLRYLARYTHRVAIGNSRLLALQDGHVTFHYRDRAGGNRERTMRLSATEFLRRFLLHVLPKGFARVRHYGILANRSEKLKRCRELLGRAPRESASGPEACAEAPLAGTDALSRCPSCGSSALVRHELPAQRWRPALVSGFDSS